MHHTVFATLVQWNIIETTARLWVDLRTAMISIGSNCQAPQCKATNFAVRSGCINFVILLCKQLGTVVATVPLAWHSTLHSPCIMNVLNWAVKHNLDYE